MKIIIGIASTTHIDAHRERIAKEALEDMANQINSKYIRQTVEHQPGLCIGVVLCAKVKQLDDEEFGLFAVFGIFEDASEYDKYTPGSPNTESEKYIYLLDDVSTKTTGGYSLQEEKDKDLNMAELLELHLDSTAIWEDGSVYKVKHLIAQNNDLSFHIYPKDHLPPHFHVVSKQRGMDARFHIETLELVSIKSGEIKKSDEKKIRNFFETHTDVWKKLKNEYRRMQQE